MSKHLETGLMLFGLLTAPAAAQAEHRTVIIVAQPGDQRAAEQNAALLHDASALRERDVIVQNLTPEAAHRLPDLGANAKTGFEVLLVGKDGGVKLRRDSPVASHEITALIDTMPMRQEEMRRRKSGAAQP